MFLGSDGSHHFSRLDYTWIDSSRKQVKLPAPTYIDYVMSWIQQTIENGKDFPIKCTVDSITISFPGKRGLITHSVGRDFQPNFPTIAKQIYRQLLRVFAHIYHAHFTHLLHLSAEGHFNSLFAHFLAFGKQYDFLVGICIWYAPSDDRSASLHLGLQRHQRAPWRRRWHRRPLG